MSIVKFKPRSTKNGSGPAEILSIEEHVKRNQDMSLQKQIDSMRDYLYTLFDPTEEFGPMWPAYEDDHSPLITYFYDGYNGVEHIATVHIDGLIVT